MSFRARLLSSSGKILRHRWTKMMFEIVFWRSVSTALSFAGTAWAVRCLGPVNVGISGIVQTFAANLVFIICLQMNSAFVRLFKETKDTAQAEHISHCLTSFRFFASLAVCALIGIALLVIGLPPAWRLAAIWSFPFVVLSVIDVSWILQAKENVPLQQRITTLRNFLTAAAYFTFFRPGIDPGWDVVVAAATTSVSVLVGWRAALGRVRGIITWQNAVGCLPYLKKSTRQAASATAGWVYYTIQMPLIGWLGNIREVGLVRSANQLASPFERTVRTFNSMIFPRFVHWRKERPDKMWRVQMIVVGGASVAAVVLGVVGALVFPWLLPWVLGPDFNDAALPCALLLSVKCMMVADENLVMSFWAQHRDNEVTRMLIGLSVVGALTLWLLVPRFGAVGAAWALLISEVLAVAWLLYRRWTTSKEEAVTAPLVAPVPVREASV